jgi:hypothetical protein
MLMQSGFVVSIALAIGLVSASMDPKVLVSIFSGTQIGGGGISLDPFINALHIAFFAGVIASIAGALVSLMRGEHRSYEEATPASTDAAGRGSVITAPREVGQPESAQ